MPLSYCGVSIVQVIDDDSGQHLRPMPGLIGIKASGPQVVHGTFFIYIATFVSFQDIYVVCHENSHLKESTF